MTEDTKKKPKTINPDCPYCKKKGQKGKTEKHGFTYKAAPYRKIQRYLCIICGQTFTA